MDLVTGGLRVIPGDFERDKLAAIDSTLAGIEAEHDVAIGLAIESGSRAWGFPSPDSDYDCRFIFVRRRDAYLSPWTRRDVIETALVDDLDINGWDLGKALKLLLKGNAVAIEWLTSPIIYRADPWFREALTDFANRHARRSAVARHYLHLGMKQRQTYFADGKAVALKKLFYALRPAMALRWLRLHPDRAVAPMHFPALMDQSDAPVEILSICRDLLVRKAETRELGTAPLPEPIQSFIDAEFAEAPLHFPDMHAAPDSAALSEADSLFRAAVARLD